MTAIPPRSPSVDYTGLAATAWERFATDAVGPDDAFFRALAARFGEPVLDVGCGSGRLLLPLLDAGVDIEGVEPSADMLALCRARAAARGRSPVLHQQRLQTLDLPRRYRTIFVACGTLHLLERAGLQVTGVTGDYTDAPVTDAHAVTVWVAVRRPGG
jgi:SAM-dependent methyltransferase